MKTLYLAGPINGCTDEEANGWRDSVMSALAGLYAFRNPMARDYRGVEHENVAEIVERDLDDVLAADMVLVNAERPTWGTAMEVWQAGMWGKKVLAVCPGPVSPWLRFVAHEVFTDMRRAVAWLQGAA